jgi:hypothetical protein
MKKYDVFTIQSEKNTNKVYSFQRDYIIKSQTFVGIVELDENEDDADVLAEKIFDTTNQDWPDALEYPFLDESPDSSFTVHDAKTGQCFLSLEPHIDGYDYEIGTVENYGVDNLDVIAYELSTPAKEA